MDVKAILPKYEKIPFHFRSENVANWTFFVLDGARGPPPPGEHSHQYFSNYPQGGFFLVFLWVIKLKERSLTPRILSKRCIKNTQKQEKLFYQMLFLYLDHRYNWIIRQKLSGTIV